jgi:PHP domain
MMITPRSLAFVASLLTLAVTGCHDDPAVTRAVPNDASRWVTGALHVHSSYSDGVGSVNDIAAAARSAGLDFVVLTDHWSNESPERAEDGYYHGVLVLAGLEAATDAGHILGIDLPATGVRFRRRNATEVMRQIRNLGGFAIVAHPDSEREEFRWTGWDLTGYEGFELFSAYSAYTQQGAITSLAHLLINPYFQTSLLDWSADWNQTLSTTWDEMLEDRKLVAWAGADAHGGIELGDGYFLAWPSYEQAFQVARNHLWLETPLTGSVGDDRARIYEALRGGHGYVSLGEGDDGTGFRFWAERGNVEVGMGGDLEPGPLTFYALSPRPDAELRLLRNGGLVSEGRGELEYGTTLEGLYRVEARRRVATLGGETLQPWIVSNPIAVLPPVRETGRIEANLLPPAEPWVIDMARVTDYPMVLNVEVVEGCMSLDLEPGEFGPDSFRAHFALEVPPTGARDTTSEPWGRCTLADRRSQDLSAYSGIRFEVRSDAVYRVRLAMADGDSFRATSFLTDTAWTEVAIPFWELGDGALDLSHVSELSFFFETSNAIPGRDTSIEIRGIALVPGA